MIRNKEIIKMTMMEIQCKLEFIQDLNKYNQNIISIIDDGLALMKELEEELKK